MTCSRRRTPVPTCPHGRELVAGGPFRYGQCYECWCEQNPSMCTQSRRPSKRIADARRLAMGVGQAPVGIQPQRPSLQSRRERSAVVAAGRVVLPLPCIHVGQPVPPPDGKPTAKKFHKCDHDYAEGDPKHPGFSRGTPKCWCTGCGPGCKGYVADADADPIQPDPETLRELAAQQIMEAHKARTPLRPGTPLKEERTNHSYPVVWSYGVTTVPTRRDNTLPITLQSLARAGFDKPHLFVDGGGNSASWEAEFDLPVTMRSDRIKTFGNWVLSLWELYLLNPWADRYALFQDDFVTYRNLRSYLSRITYPGEKNPPGTTEQRVSFDPKIVRQDTDARTRGYLNLYTFPSNQKLCPSGHVGFYRSNQFGRGAVALIFNREAVITLLGSPHMCERPIDKGRGHKSVDGAIVTALAKAGWCEYVHNPTLVQHIGDRSSMGNKKHLKAISFLGEEFDAEKLLEKVQPAKT